MHQFKELALMVTATVSGFPGKTADELKLIPDCWLNTYSIWGICTFLERAEREEWVRSRPNKKGELRYWATKKGKREYEKYSQ